MEMVYYTIAAIILYKISDFILNSIEIKMGKRLASRSVIFLIIITILAMVSFNIIRAIFGPLQTNQQSQSTQLKQTDKKPAVSPIKPNATETKK